MSLEKDIKSIMEADVFKPASGKEVSQRLANRRRYRLVYAYAVDVVAADEQEARNLAEELDLEPKDERIVDSTFIDLDDVYEVNAKGVAQR